MHDLMQLLRWVLTRLIRELKTVQANLFTVLEKNRYLEAVPQLQCTPMQEMCYWP